MIFCFCKVQLYIVKSVLSNDKRKGGYCMKKVIALLLGVMVAANASFTPALAYDKPTDLPVKSEDQTPRRAEYISYFFDDPPVGNASDYTADEFTRTGNVTWDKWAVDLTTIAVVGILAHSLGASSEDAFSMGTTAADLVQTALEEYAPYSGSLDYEDTVTVYDEVSTVTSQYRKHVVIYTLETGVELEPITFYEVRSWV